MKKTTPPSKPKKNVPVKTALKAGYPMADQQVVFVQPPSYHY